MTFFEAMIILTLKQKPVNCNIYFLLRFGLANAINNQPKVKNSCCV